ncbi:hypothetical protein WI89_01050 [Burkholderia ubonensis]|uniref:hypothetical protein n=1 Tax=Burkholderia ubonensis TaxID=101571 RepID=UPI000755CD57|nr:hypothetical protein [Burkholderia ubonensis]KVD71841.1 hypothetical protein WI89_01050 [Burkholderia ubonensis]
MTSKLTFHIERDGKYNVLTYQDGGCRPATPEEIELWDALLAPTQQPSGEVTDAARDVLAERRRHVEAEGWTPERDDEHSNGELARAAACYAHAAGSWMGQHRMPAEWPWEREWWKPSTPRRDLVKAGALILAEIERLDRRPDCVRAADEACEDVQKLVDGIAAARAQGGE